MHRHAVGREQELQRLREENIELRRQNAKWGKKAVALRHVTEAIWDVLSVRDPKVSDAHKMVAVLIASRLNENKRCWPKQKTIARHLGKSVATVKRAVAHFIRLGILDRERQGYASGNAYRYCRPHSAQPGEPNGTTESAHPLIPQSAQPGDPSIGSARRSLGNDRGEQGGGTRTEGHAAGGAAGGRLHKIWIEKAFPHFWSMYPRHVKKIQAEKAFVALMPPSQAMFQDKLNCIVTLLEHRKGQDWSDRESDKIPYPCTFLETESFSHEDVLDAVQRGQQATRRGGQAMRRGGECRRCDGTGKVPSPYTLGASDPCNACNATGRR